MQRELDRAEHRVLSVMPDLVASEPWFPLRHATVGVQVDILRVLYAVAQQWRVRGAVVVPTAASQLRFRKEVARRATLQTCGFATQVRLVGVSGFNGELGDLRAGLSADPSEGEKALEAKDAVQCRRRQPGGALEATSELTLGDAQR